MTRQLFLFMTFTLFVTRLVPALAQTESTGEFAIKKQYLLERHDDYYDRFELLDQLEAERLRGETQTRAIRKQQVEEYERARQEFVRQRRPKSEQDSMAWEAELKARTLAAEKARQDFVLKRDEMKRALGRVGVIDANEELGIDPTPDNLND